jgi:hypothetical protein
MEGKMRYRIAAIVVSGGLAVTPIVGIAAPAAQTQSSTRTSSAQAVASHATTGTVKAIDGSTLIITRSGKKGGDIAFTLNPSTLRDGEPVVGTAVSVRYREDGKSLIATAITVQHPKQHQAGATPPASKEGS